MGSIQWEEEEKDIQGRNGQMNDRENDRKNEQMKDLSEHEDVPRKVNVESELLMTNYGRKRRD